MVDGLPPSSAPPDAMARPSRRDEPRGRSVSTVRVVARRDLGRRWRRVVVVIVLVGVVGAVTLAMAAGARRTSTALDRFMRDSRSADEKRVSPA